MHQVIFCTCPTQDIAETIATQLVESKLAACVNLLPGVTSIYMWQGKVEKDSEVILKIKSNAMLFDRIAQKISDIHPYEVPEIIALDLKQGNQAYLDWLDASVEIK